MKCEYPFIPKSNGYLLRGQFWAIPLLSGKYACGMILDLPAVKAKNLKIFYAGLVNWVGSELPTYGSIAGCSLLEQGHVHIKTISIFGLGQAILGCRPLGLVKIEHELRVDTVYWSEYAVVKRGLR